MSKVSIATKGNLNLESHLQEAHRDQAFCKFSKGCSDWFKEDGGVYCGTDPFGQDFAINTHDWLESVTNKLTYWDEDIDESGHIIN
ncbi:hypothetical protein [Reinekea sp. G2M2-21]|uniref:hypothetical protein n=1 Tax=Reinekea sp. G2M2-21 TaxID=2788942 RepID=UPI0018A90EF2|nr:hypothetical protein [Reinekea sp. G2M2-21]